MVDLHSHILPGVDDGSKDLETTRQMLQLLHEQGVDTVVATSHFYARKDTPERFLRRREAALEQVAQLQGEYPKIIPGAEVAYFDGMEYSDALELLQLGKSRMLLVEMPFCQWSDRMVRTICDLPLMIGLIPVLAHVNRYCAKDQLLPYQEQLLKSGVLFQYNAGAFLSWKERRWALKQLDADCVHFLGSDAHNLTKRAPRLQEAAQVIIKKRGAAVMDEITAFSTHMLEDK